jgi:hypothetical protein
MFFVRNTGSGIIFTLMYIRESNENCKTEIEI